MEKNNIHEIKPDSDLAKYFEGKVQIKKIITESLTKDFEIYLRRKNEITLSWVWAGIDRNRREGIVVLQTGINQTGDNIGVIKMDDIHFPPS